jgi:hypothetical protein
MDSTSLLQIFKAYNIDVCVCVCVCQASFVLLDVEFVHLLPSAPSSTSEILLIPC